MKMLFFCRGGFSGINDSLLNAWKKKNPEIDIFNIDLNKLATENVLNKACNCIACSRQRENKRDFGPQRRIG